MTPDPLDRLLRAAIRKACDEKVIGWLRELLHRGERVREHGRTTADARLAVGSLKGPARGGSRPAN
jgi:hypothetical protein